MKTRYGWRAVGCAALIWVGAEAQAGSPGAGMMEQGAPQHPAALIMERLAALNLSDAQKHDIAVALKTHREDVRNTLKYYTAARKNLFEAIHRDTLDEQAVRDASRVVAMYEEELSVVRARLTADIKPILTPEQRQTLKETREGFRERIASRLDTGRAMLDMWIERNSAN